MNNEVKNIEKYWEEKTKLKEYSDPNIKRRKFLVNKIGEHINTDVDCTLHEFGCNVGSNLKKITDTFKNIKVTGNDIGQEAVNRSFSDDRIKIYLSNTCEYVKDMDPVDYIVTMAHIIHIPNEYDDILKKWMPIKFNKKLFLFEQNIKSVKKLGKSELDIKFPRDLDNFFPDLKLIEKIQTNYSNYKLWIFSK